MARRAPLRFDPIAEAHRQWIAHDLGEEEAMAATTSIMRAQALILHRVDAALAPFGLTFARYEVLALLQLTRSGALPLGKMGSRLMVHPASVTNAVDRLSEAGLVRRVPHPTDGRATLAEITDDGRDVVARATKALGAIRYGLDDVSDEACRQLTGLIDGLRRGVDFVDE
jgi:DNA-binding MarR family transcriptional regulator